MDPIPSYLHMQLSPLSLTSSFFSLQTHTHQHTNMLENGTTLKSGPQTGTGSQAVTIIGTEIESKHIDICVAR